MTETQTAALGSVPLTRQAYNYDLMGRAMQNRQTVDINVYTMGYVYNVGGALTSQTYPSGRAVNYAYDDAARLSQVSSGGTTYANQFMYGNQGLLTSVALGNGGVQTFDYNSRLQLKSIDLTKSGTQLQHYDYKYGVYDPGTNTLDETKNNGKIAQIEGFIGAQKQWQQRFAYDSLGRLKSAREYRGDNSQQSYLLNYDYDVFGNRYQYQSQNGGNPFSQSWVEAGQISQTSNRYTSGVTYDAAGNITQDTKFRNLQFQYDANNRQWWAANLDGSGAVTAVFDGAGQRLATISNGIITSISVYDAMGKLVAEYGEGGGTNGTQYLMSDHQGSPRVMMKSSGAAAELVRSRHDYLPFGEEIYAGVGMRSTAQFYNQTDGVRQKYAGMEKDDASGMAHTLWRKYDSLSGRWTTTDPYGGSMILADPQSFNRYAYVSNNPVNLTDPTGMMEASQGWSDVSAGFWGSGSLGGNGWGSSPRPGQNIINNNFRSDVRSTVRWRSIQYSDDGGGDYTEHSYGWWEKAWESSERPAPAFELGHLYYCKRPTNVTGPLSFVNRFAYHYWIKTDEKEAGLGGEEGGVPGQDAPPDSPYLSFTRINSHKGESEQANASCELVPDADPQIANRLLEVGKPMGRFTATNNCYVFALNVKEKARRSHEKFVQKFLSKPYRK